MPPPALAALLPVMVELMMLFPLLLKLPTMLMPPPLVAPLLPAIVVFDILKLKVRPENPLPVLLVIDEFVITTSWPGPKGLEPDTTPPPVLPSMVHPEMVSEPQLITAYIATPPPTLPVNLQLVNVTFSSS